MAKFEITSTLDGVAIFIKTLGFKILASEYLDGDKETRNKIANFMFNYLDTNTGYLNAMKFKRLEAEARRLSHIPLATRIN